MTLKIKYEKRLKQTFGTDPGGSRERIVCFDFCKMKQFLGQVSTRLHSLDLQLAKTDKKKEGKKSKLGQIIYPFYLMSRYLVGYVLG